MYLGSGDWFGATAGNTHLDSAAFLNQQTDPMAEISRERRKSVWDAIMVCLAGHFFGMPANRKSFNVCGLRRALVSGVGLLSQVGVADIQLNTAFCACWGGSFPLLPLNFGPC